MTDQNIAAVEVEANDPSDIVEVNAPDVAELEQADQTDEVANQDDGEQSSEDTPFPKKAVNAISRHKKQANKYKAERDALAMEIQALQKMVDGSKSAQPMKEPDLADFDTVGEYMRAQAKFEAVNAINQDRGQQAQDKINSLKSRSTELYQDERADVIANKAQELFNTVPNAKQLFAEVMPVLEQLPPEIQQIAEALDNAPLAIYNLYNDGTLEQLGQMPPVLAAQVLYQAQLKQPTVPNKVSQAPTPISAAKGSGTAKKPITQMNANQLLDWVNQ